MGIPCPSGHVFHHAITNSTQWCLGLLFFRKGSAGKASHLWRSCLPKPFCVCDRVRGNRAYVGEIDFEIWAKAVGTLLYCLKFRVSIVESCQEF